ncbi:MAG: hypothetical protein MK116_12250 [Phycisphaerales bacterium]|nr:hypothetical protein [Phycisphaerales bacterium]
MPVSRDNLPGLLAVLSLLAVSCGCTTHEVQYRKKPAYYHQMASSSFNDGMTRDGVEIRWEEPESVTDDLYEGSIGGEPFRLREESEDGEVVIRAHIPQHVLVNTLGCLRNGEYQLLWDQMLANSTREFYLRQEDGYRKYEAHLRKHRKDMAAFLNRMIAGRVFGEVETTKAPDGTVRCRLRKKLRSHFKFKEVLIVSEGPGLKLLTIR